MKFGTRALRIAAYVCPRGVFCAECTDAAGGVEVRRTFGESIGVRTADEAADRLVALLREAGIPRARVSVTIRGFGVAHHTLQLPPATDALLDGVIEREIRRLEPHLADCIVQWTSLPPLQTGATGPEGAPAQRAILASAAPREVVVALEDGLHAAGHRLEHLTTLPVALQRIVEQFDSGTGAVAAITALPDAAYIAFSLEGGVRLSVEPPLPQDAEHEAAALAEELELAATFVRQQFRGALVDRVVVLGARESLAGLKATVAERLGVPVKHLEEDTLPPVALAALGALLDGRAASPQSLGGATRVGSHATSRSRLQTAATAAVFLMTLTGVWTVAETVRTVRAGQALEAAARRVEQDDFGLGALRSTARQRSLVASAVEAVRVAGEDRSRIQAALAALAVAFPAPVRLDTLRLAWSDGSWQAVVGGVVAAASNARAVQVLHDVYRELPERLDIESLTLDRLAYDDGPTGGESGSVRFQLSFALRNRAEPGR